MPAGATQQRTIKVLEKIEKHFMEEETQAVETIITVSGFSFAGRGQNMGLAFVKLKDWSLRKSADVITSYSIHYTKLYEQIPGHGGKGANLLLDLAAGLQAAQPGLDFTFVNIRNNFV